MSVRSGPAADGAAKKRILLVEDDRDTRELVRLWLEDGAYEIDESGSAEDALQLSHGNAFDLAMVDVMLPGIDGFELASKLSPTPVLLMSVTDIEDVPGDTSAAGFLSKPFSRAGLERAVLKALAPG